MPKAAKQGSSKPGVTFAELRSLYRLKIDAEPVVAFLAKHPEHIEEEPSDGSEYVLFYSAGFSLLFRALPGTPAKGAKANRVLTTIALYAGGTLGKYARFAGLPFGLVFGASREELHGKLGEPFDSAAKRKISGLTWEKWRCDDLTVHTSFDEAGNQCKAYSVSIVELAQV